MDGLYNIAGESFEGRVRRNEYRFRLPLHLPQYVGGEEPEPMVQGKMGRRIEEGQGWETPTMREGESKIVWKRIPEVQALGESLKRDPKDFWFDVKWTEKSSHKTKKSQETGDWWETDDC